MRLALCYIGLIATTALAEPVTAQERDGEVSSSRSVGIPRCPQDPRCQQRGQIFIRSITSGAALGAVIVNSERDQARSVFARPGHATVFSRKMLQNLAASTSDIDRRPPNPDPVIVFSDRLTMPVTEARVNQILWRLENAWPHGPTGEVRAWIAVGAGSTQTILEPGGIGIPLRLLSELSSDEELAFILAHHLVERRIQTTNLGPSEPFWRDWNARLTSVADRQFFVDRVAFDLVFEAGFDAVGGAEQALQHDGTEESGSFPGEDAAGVSDKESEIAPTASTRLLFLSNYVLEAYLLDDLLIDSSDLIVSTLRNEAEVRDALQAQSVVETAIALAETGNLVEAISTIEPAMEGPFGSEPFVLNAAAEIRAMQGEIGIADRLYSRAGQSPNQTIEGFEAHARLLARVGLQESTGGTVRQRHLKLPDTSPLQDEGAHRVQNNEH